MNRNVSVSRDDRGVLRAHHEGFRAADGVTRQILPVAGGLLEIDAAAPERGVGALIEDVDAASWWVPFVFGDAATAALYRLDDPADFGADMARTVEVAAVEDTVERSLEQVAVRLAFGLWQRRWLPAGAFAVRIEEWLLDAELGALAAQAEMLLDGTEVVDELLEPHAVRIVSEFLRVLDAAGDADLRTLLATDLDAGVIQRAVFAVAETLDDEAPGWERADRVAARVRAVHGAGGTASDVVAALAADRDGLDEAGETDESVDAGDADPAPAEADAAPETTAPVDWTAVHPRQLSAAPDALRWVVGTQGPHGHTVAVSVAAPRDEVSHPVESGELFARIEDDEGIRVAALSFDPVGERFEGRQEVSGAHGVRVTVYSDVFGVGGRTATPDDEAAAVRSAVSDVARRRTQDLLAGTAVPAAFAFERRALRGPDSVEDAVVAAAMTDLDLEWLLLAETSLALLGPGDLTARSVVDEEQGFRVDLMPVGGAWRVRVTSLGGGGSILVSVRFSSGAVVDLALEVGFEGSASARVAAPAEDAPVAVRIVVTGR